MAADYIINPSLSPSGNRYQSFTALATALGSNKNRTTVNLGRATEIQIDADLVESYDFAAWTTDATNSILIYGITRAIKWSPSGAYTTAFSNANKHIKLQKITLYGSGYAGCTGGAASTNGWIHKCIVKNFTNGSNNSYGLNPGNGGKITFNTVTDCDQGIRFSRYDTITIANNTAVKNKINIKQGDNGANNATIWNNVAFGGSTANWSNLGACTSARNNAGASGDSVPDTVGSTAITVTSADFVDYTNSDFHIPSNSKLHHTDAGYPTGNNQVSGLVNDIDDEALPTSYATGADRFDTGSDYYVLIVVGTTYYRDTDLAAVASASAIKRASDNAAFTIADLVVQDTLEIRTGAKVHIKDNGSAVFNMLQGLKINIVNGELWMENALTTLGQTFFGVQGGALTVGAQGKFYVRGNLILLADLSGGSYSSSRTLNHNEWDNMWTTGSKDSLSKYGEPAVLFVGTSAGTAVPYFNKGSGATVGALATDVNHGRTFTFAQATGIITWTDHVPTTSEKVYCWNIMIHSKDGQGTPVQSYAFDTTGKGAIDAEKFYFTGNPNYKDANSLRLAGLGVLQPYTVDHCYNVSLGLYQGVSQQNEQLGTCTLKNLKNEFSIGSIYGFTNGSVLKLQALHTCNFTEIFAEGFGAQTSGAYRIIIDGTDDCDFGQIDVIDGGISFENAISVNPRIRVLNHSNDQSGSNGNNSQHVVNGASSGTRGLRVDQINLIASGFPTALDLVNVVNAGNGHVLSVSYNAVIRNILTIEASFNFTISSVVIARCTAQGWKSIGTNSGIVLQGVKNTASPSSPPAMVEYSSGTSDVSLRNFPYETSDRYTGWVLPVTDLNFMELNLGNASTGKLVMNFFQSTKGIYAFTGTAKSDNAGTVLLPAVSDSVIVEWPYDILVGSASPYFTTTAMVLVGTNTGNLTFEFAVNNNAAGYGAWTTLNATNLNALSLTNKFRIKFRIICATASATNAIGQIIMSINIDTTVVYPAFSGIITLRNMIAGAEYLVYKGAPTTNRVVESIRIASGTAPGGTVVLPNIPFDDLDTISVRVRKSSTSSNPDYLPFETQSLLSDANSGADIYVNQILDTVST